MEEVIARIKEYVLVINSELEDDAFLDFVVADVVDKALVFMNRVQLIEAFELDNTKEAPIPRQLERTLASVVVGVHMTIKSRNAGEMSVSSVSDNGQSVSYRSEVASFLSSSNDSEVFSGSLALLKLYRLPTIIKTNNEITD